MNTLLKSLGAGIAGIMISTAGAHAALVSTNSSLSDQGVAASIIVAPADVSDDAATNEAIQAFDEVQMHVLAADLAVDGGTISAGTVISSHMIFLNSDGPGLIEHGAGGGGSAATFTFDGMILGVMSDSGGTLEAASSSFLGAAGTIYPGAFTARGMEGDPLDGLINNDYYSFLTDTITVGMRVTEPGDWIRVITASEIPVPAALPLLLSGIAGLGFASRRRREAK
ncbi:MAG: hypothetical protein HKP25_11190 [Marinicaulis sp.]|nr:VPLPA-CTERM sorting domain-containing protein [Marinicaulis sp.]NNL89624.1 hypothetical protein [Marinicaulis sp.]